ncbi:polyubiquitin binding protein, putative [Plasmodium knowlesi strain H]|uniref:Polyubiquitin binding protein, putative n=3 Tax=Plasmodium knowlesi TaxID=5850 RepID=A0A1A7W291_PLAKH|nr:polyubiquitin binding protein, putative [Plasmodium knowlesi strain H]OTN64556.1 putative Polyubiquitin binding protein [Plasmodium knowlesi]CAA9988908.1 polyubiquitin binding protein, putative [Plasmodium knowlesi strain H]SBO24753.1 polyubiquitin binding protein, putative [Plasmodium knowlesi strain H]SBO28017.1 polyubiquitin binding protein, putative [Plasmodium knowlesi strain H]VVS78382.1 polyubiquitin binding protein, putative [Plasmodium knowlesi strain H]
MEDTEYKLRGVLAGHSKGVRCMCIINNTQLDELEKCQLTFDYIISADMTGTIMVWKKKTGEEILTDEILPPDESPYNDVETFPSHLSDNYQLYRKIEIHERFVYALTHSKYVGISELKKCTHNVEDHLYVYSGGSDKGVYLFNLNGYIELMLQGHKNSVSSIVEYSENILLSADWNGEVIMWQIVKIGDEFVKGKHLENSIPSSENANKEKNTLCGNKYTYSIVKILNNHKYATYVNCLNEFILTISQNNIINVWNSQGEKTDEVKNIHSDSVRDIVLFNGNKNAITFSNDETINIYDSNFNLLKMYKGHQGFIFCVCVNEKEQIMYSCGDDKSIKVWCIKDIYELMKKYDTEGGAILNKLPLMTQGRDNSCLQTIYLTDTLWSVKVLSNGDLACACNDSYIRVYTKKRNHMLTEEAAKEVLELCNKRNKKENPNGENSNSTGGENDPKNIISVENIKSVVGKEGEVKIFKNKKKYEAYKYENNEWVLIGEVVDDSTSQKKFYIGDNLFQQGYYDEIISIDTGYGNIKLLPYNASDNVHVIAEMFCKREGLSASQIKPIVDFINQNYASKGGTSTSSINTTNSSFGTHNGSTPYGAKKFNTVLNVFTVEKSALDKIFQKIQEFNSLQASEEEQKCKLSNEQINSLSNIINLYKKNIKNLYNFNTGDINLIMKLFNWSPSYIFPVIDLLRVLVLNKNCDFLYNNKYAFNAFKLVYDCVAYYISNWSMLKENEENKLDSLLLCCLRFYLNMFNLSTPRFYMYKKFNFVAKQLAEVKSTNFNINTLCLKIFFNYVITLNENNDQAMRKSVFEVLHSIEHKINDIELLYTFSLCFHTSHEMNTKETNEIVKKYGSLDFMKNKLDSLLPHKNEQNEKVFKNVGSILEDLSA